MRQMFTPEEFVAEVERRAESAQDYLFSTASLDLTSVVGGSILRATTEDEGVETNHAWGVNDIAHQQIAARLNIPVKYYRRMQANQPDLLDTNVKTWFDKGVDNEGPENRLVRTLDGNVRAFLSDRYQRIDNLQVLSAISPILAELQGEHGAKIISSALTDKKMYLKVVVPDIEGEIPPPQGFGGAHRIKDVCWPGFVISNSETGHGMYSVDKMVYRRVCDNGLIWGDSISRRHVGGRIVEDDVFSDKTRRLDDELILSMTRDLVEDAVNATRFAAMMERMGETWGTPPSADPVKTCEALAKSFDLTDEERTHVLRAFSTDASQNGFGLFGLVNAVTRASQDVEDYERATDLEKLGGVLLDTSDREWLKLAGIAA